MPIFGRRSFSCLFFFIYGDFDMYGAGSISAGDHKFLPFLKRYPNQLIFCTQGFFDMENSNLKDFLKGVCKLGPFGLRKFFFVTHIEIVIF